MKPPTRYFLVGAIAYPALELLHRGRTHWSMALTGGLCAAQIYRISQRRRDRPLLVQAFLDACMITSIEFAVGLFVNCLFQMEVWDYSDRRGNLLGQVCPAFFFLWLLLSLPVAAYARYRED